MTMVLGPIVRLQVQRSPLKVGDKPHRRYVTEPLEAVPELLVDHQGVSALVMGREVLDVHHGAHPATRSEDGTNAISVGFTAHYRAMVERFGDHVTPGCAGENILVETHHRVRLEDLQGGLVVVDPAGRPKARLVSVAIARPCRPFAGFAHKHQTVAPAALQDSLVFLDDGMRGFYCSLGAGDEPARLRHGDLVVTG